MKNKNQKSLIFLLLLLAISVGYALIATTLKINGSSNVKSARWNVYWDNVQIKSGSVETTEENSAQIVDQDKTIVEYTVELSNPGDFYEFTVDAVNDGSLDAMIETITDSGLTASQKEYINYSVKYSDGTTVTEKDKLTAHTRETYKVRLEYRTDIDPTKLPEGNQTLDLSFEIKYVQADNTAVVRPRSCNEYLYAEGNITTSQYNTICGYYIDEGMFTYSDNDDGTITLTGLQSGVTLDPKVFALPTSIDNKTVTKVAGDAFDGKITSEILVISPTITTVEDGFSTNEFHYPFARSSIRGVAIPNSVTYLGMGAFLGNENLTFVNVGKGVTKINGGTFANCTSLKSVVLNDNITMIEGGAFSATSISSIDIPKGVTRLYGGTFMATKIEKMVIPDTITDVDSGSFASTKVREYNTGNGVTTLSYGIFDTSELRKYVIGDGVTEIPNGYFSNNEGCPKLEEVVIGKNVTTIGFAAFNTANLTTLTIPENVTTIRVPELGQGTILKNETSNPNLTKIINKTGRAFDWNGIVTGQSGESFVTGTVETPYGNVEITAE